MADVEKGHSVEATRPEHGLAHSRALPAGTSATAIANPASLGLFSFASTTFMLSMYNASAKSIAEPNVVVGMALFCGGLAQLLAGMWEFPRGNTFGATAFTSYGAFWLSYATILIPGSGIVDAYKGDMVQFENAVGFFLLAWLFVTFFLLIASLRKNIGLSVLFFTLDLTFLLLAIGAFTGKAGVNKAGGVVGVITAFVAYYIGFADLIAAEKRPLFGAPLGPYKAD